MGVMCKQREELDLIAAERPLKGREILQAFLQLVAELEEVRKAVRPELEAVRPRDLYNERLLRKGWEMLHALDREIAGLKERIKNMEDAEGVRGPAAHGNHGETMGHRLLTALLS
jgi:hypothetical protein